MSVWQDGANTTRPALRFCLKRRAGYSAYILDEFVRTELRDLECDAFNPHATHGSICLPIARRS